MQTGAVHWTLHMWKSLQVQLRNEASFIRVHLAGPVIRSSVEIIYIPKVFEGYRKEGDSTVPHSRNRNDQFLLPGVFACHRTAERRGEPGIL